MDFLEDDHTGSVKPDKLPKDSVYLPREYIQEKRERGKREDVAKESLKVIFAEELRKYTPRNPRINIVKVMDVVLDEICLEEMEEALVIHKDSGIIKCVDYLIDILQ